MKIVFPFFEIYFYAGCRFLKIAILAGLCSLVVSCDHVSKSKEELSDSYSFESDSNQTINKEQVKNHWNGILRELIKIGGKYQEGFRLTIPEHGVLLTQDELMSGDVIQIDGPIWTQGYSLRIFCKQIHFGEKGGIYLLKQGTLPTFMKAKVRHSFYSDYSGPTHQLMADGSIQPGAVMIFSYDSHPRNWKIQLESPQENVGNRRWLAAPVLLASWLENENFTNDQRMGSSIYSKSVSTPPYYKHQEMIGLLAWMQ